MPSFTIQVVISRFREDLLPLLALLIDSSTFHADALVTVIVYNKDGTDSLQDVLASAVAVKRRTSEKSTYDKVQALITLNTHFSIQNIENFGREADTYLHHIVKNHASLADVTVFLPASCMNDVKVEHTKQLLQRVNSTRNTVLAGQWVVPTVRGRLGPFMIKNWTGTDKNNAQAQSDVGAAAIACQPSTRRPYSVWYDHFFPGLRTNVVCYYSMLAVSAEHITRQTVSYYQQFLSEVHVHVNPETGHYMERSWEAVFYPLPESCIYAAKPIQQAPASASQLKQAVEKKKIQMSSFSQLVGLIKSQDQGKDKKSSGSGSGSGASMSTYVDDGTSVDLGKRKRERDKDTNAIKAEEDGEDGEEKEK